MKNSYEAKLPPRPYVPPTAFLALASCASCAFMLEAGWRRHETGRLISIAAVSILLLLALLVGIVAWAISRKYKSSLLRTFDNLSGVTSNIKQSSGVLYVQKALFCICLGFLAGLAASCCWLIAWQQHAQNLEGKSVSSLALEVQGDPRISDRGVSLSAQAWDQKSESMLAWVRVSLPQEYNANERLTAVGRIEKLDMSGWARSRFMKGEVAHIQVVKVLRADTQNRSLLPRMRASLCTALSPTMDDAHALVVGTVCGRTTELAQTDANGVFARCGLSHLVAVSGSHLAFIALLLNVVFERLRMPKAVQNALLLSMMVLYVLFTGCVASAMRSVLMVASSMGAALLKRRTHPLSGLSLSVLILVLINPGIVFDLGFLLSALSVLFLLVFGGYLTCMLERLRIPEMLAEPLSLTLAAQWATLPLTVPVFGELSLIAPLANLVVGPLMSALLLFGLVLTPLAALFHANYLLAPVVGLARLCISSATLLARIPFAAVAAESTVLLPMLSYGSALLIYTLWSDIHAAVLAGGIALATSIAGAYVLYWTHFAPPELVVLDVGQADAILLRDGGHTVLVDAGVDEQVVRALARNHVFKLDAVLITHWDSDHWGGLPSILANFPVERLFVACGARANIPLELEEDSFDVQELSLGDVLELGHYSCRVVWPQTPVEGNNNEDSLCLRVGYLHGDARLAALLTGDAERNELVSMAPSVWDIDMLKVGHHGSKASLAKEPLDVLKPELIVASAGEGNRYGHPDPQCLQLAQQADATFLCTKDVGDVHVYPNARGLRIATNR